MRDTLLALDLYAWSTYKTYQAIRRKREMRVSWHQLHAQIGTDYKCRWWSDSA